MIHAALAGKLDCLDSEDALTCAVFTRLRYLPPQVLSEWLATARSHTDPTAGATPRTSEPVIEFWPSIRDTLRGHGSVEPDIVLRFDDEVIVIEAKLWSFKSQTRDGVDQLARQWHGAHDHHGAHIRMCSQIYLTPDLAPPRAALAESADAMGVGASSLWWLSWTSLVPILERQLAIGDRVSRIVASDLLAYLTRVGLIRFHGWRLDGGWQRHACWTYHQSAPVTYWRATSIKNACWTYRQPAREMYWACDQDQQSTMELSTMSDLTAGAGEAYAACKTLFEDLNRLAIDFGHSIRSTGIDLPKSEEYSYSPHELLMKRDHVWMSYRLDESVLAFAAAM